MVSPVLIWDWFSRRHTPFVALQVFVTELPRTFDIDNIDAGTPTTWLGPSKASVYPAGRGV
jgi:hypothetical protein